MVIAPPDESRTATGRNARKGVVGSLPVKGLYFEKRKAGRQIKTDVI